ncbi:WD40 repeat domain-containing protein [Nonomuraea angiospora]|uniref:WD40 repeat domain-containing protein n=1 Tax=Nonomuraea angiospora TaxID=46172 RepID=UPI0037A2A5D2
MPVDGISFELRDVAGLRLEEELPQGVEPATLISADDGPAGERRIGAWGPNRDGQQSRPGNVVGSLVGAYDQVRLQVDGEFRGTFRVQAGYSGGPVWDQSTGQVVGIVQAVPKNDRAYDVYVISADTLVRAWPEVLYRPPPNPYQGLSAFSEADAPFFFGREHFITELMTAAEERPLLLVAGRSGVGKSSVVAAGLTPQLRRKHTLAVGSFRPGDDPMPRLAGALAQAAGAHRPYPVQELQAWQDRVANDGLTGAATYVCAATGASHLLLIIDQFEQLFTECGADQRATLINVLNRLLSERSQKVRVTASMRNDFHYLLVEAPDPLGTYVKDFWHHLRPMTAEDLHRAIAEPARVAGGPRPVTFDDGLVELICDDFQGRPGELPLLEFTLTRLWELQRGRKLTLQTYRDLGGVTGALSQYAEQRFEALALTHQEAAQRIFTELLQPDNSEIARQIRRTDLRGDDWPIVELLRDARLLAITTTISGEQIVEIAHEALLRGWDRLRGWAEDGREFRIWKAGVIADRQRWENHQRDPDQLLRGSALRNALNIATKHAADIEGIAQYISLSKQHADSEKAERSQLLRQPAAVRLARQSLDALNTATGHPLALALGILSLQTTPTFDGDLALRSALRLAGRPQERLFHDGRVWSVVFSPDGRLVATAAEDGTARVWDPVTGTELTRLTHQDDLVRAVVFNPGGRLVATAADDGTARVWDAATGTELTRLTHGVTVLSVAFSPDGTRVASASADGTARVWDATLGTELTRLTHGGTVLSVVFSPDGRLVATAGDDGTARVWDATLGTELTRLTHENKVFSAVFDPEGGTRVATASADYTARVWDAAAGTELACLFHDGEVNQIVFSPSGRLVATAADDGTARVWDAALGTELTRLTHGVTVWAVVFSPDGGLVATAGDDGTARVWDTTAGIELTRLTHGGEVWSVMFSPDGRRVAAADTNGTARVWDAAAGGETTHLVHGGTVLAVVFSPDGTHLAGASADGTARVWDATLGTELTRLTHGGTVLSVVFSPDGRLVATAGDDGTARVWDATLGTELTRLTHGGTVLSVVFSPDGRLVATAGDDSSARVWDAVTGTELTRLAHYRDLVRAVVFSPNGRLVATAGDDSSARVWDAATGDQLTRLFHSGTVLSVVFSPDGTRIATAGSDGGAQVWDAATGDQLTRFFHSGRVLSVVFSPDSMRVATASEDGTARVWDASAGTELARMIHGGTVLSVVFSPDGTRIAIAGRNGIARVWDATTGAELARLTHNDEVNDVVFSPDGMRVATACDDGTARVWALGSHELTAQALERMTINLTEEQWDRYVGPDTPYRTLMS